MSRWERAKVALTPAEWRRAALLATIIAGLHVAGFGILLAAVVPHHYDLGESGCSAWGSA